MAKEKLFSEVVLQITEMFEVSQVDFRTDNGKPDGGKIGATMLFYSGLVVMMSMCNNGLMVGYGHITGAPYTQRMGIEKELLKSICTIAYTNIIMK